MAKKKLSEGRVLQPDETALIWKSGSSSMTLENAVVGYREDNLEFKLLLAAVIERTTDPRWRRSMIRWLEKKRT